VKSLNKGPSKIVPVKMPDDQKAAAQAAADEVGEKLSEFIRVATAERVKRVKRRKKTG
jgi:hypothetical protein